MQENRINQAGRRGRPRRQRRIGFEPGVYYFKPRGVALRLLKEVELYSEELEALRLKNIENLNQEEAAQKMDISQSTFQRILVEANRKTAEALVNGYAIRINN